MLPNLLIQMITMDNAEEYVDLMFDFCMHTGIQKQMEAFRGNIKGPRIPFPFDISINILGITEFAPGSGPQIVRSCSVGRTGLNT